MHGARTLACIDGTHWNGSEPYCEIIKEMRDEPIEDTISSAECGRTSVLVITFLLMIINTTV